jgi:hypothetical protein
VSEEDVLDDDLDGMFLLVGRILRVRWFERFVNIVDAFVRSLRSTFMQGRYALDGA